MIGLDASFYGKHSLRRTKATLIHKKTGNLRVVQLLRGHTKVVQSVSELRSMCACSSGADRCLKSEAEQTCCLKA
jgi:hypothetical protein